MHAAKSTPANPIAVFSYKDKEVECNPQWPKKMSLVLQQQVVQAVAARVGLSLDPDTVAAVCAKVILKMILTSAQRCKSQTRS